MTLTGLYNELAKLRAEQPLSAKEKTLHEHGLVAVLRSLHDELDAAVLQAYGWADLQSALADHRPAAAEARAAAVETLLERLVGLNARRAAEEVAGLVRWLRPEFQARPSADQGAQAGLEVDVQQEDEAVPAASPQPLALAELELRFQARGRWRERLPVILDTLAALGRARPVAGEAADQPARWAAA